MGGRSVQQWWKMNAAAAATNDVSSVYEERVFSQRSRLVIPQLTAFNASKSTTMRTATTVATTHNHRSSKKAKQMDKQKMENMSEQLLDEPYATRWQWRLILHIWMQRKRQTAVRHEDNPLPAYRPICELIDSYTTSWGRGWQNNLWDVDFVAGEAWNSGLERNWNDRK